MSAGDWYLALYTLGVGISLPLFWVVAGATGHARRMGEGRDDWGWHIAAEFLTAAFMIVAGVAIISGASWATPVTGVALGTILYSIAESPGHYIARKEYRLAALVIGPWVLLPPAIVLLIQR